MGGQIIENKFRSCIIIKNKFARKPPCLEVPGRPGRHFIVECASFFGDTAFMSHSTVSRPPLWPYFVLAVLAVAADQITKIMVLHHIPFQARLPVIDGFFDLTHVYNPGAAFSFLADAGGWQKYFFTGFAVVVCLYLGRNILKREFRGWSAWAAAMIMGGAIGNVIDRLLYGHVVDFLLVYWRNHYYPAFNIADSFICVGAALFVWVGIQEARREKRQQAT